MELEDIVNEEMLTTEDVNNMLEHTDKGRTKQTKPISNRPGQRQWYCIAREMCS